jgi:uncharacterized protein (TIGR03435 family)
MRLLPVLLLSIALPAAKQSLPSQASGPAFEAISIHEHPPGTPGKVGFYSTAGGRVELGYATLMMLVQYALDVDAPDISGAPSWSTKAVYDVMAVPPDSSPSRKLNLEEYTASPTAEQRAMILNMLKERFGLRYHTEMTDRPVYFLERGKGPLKLDSAKHPERAADPRCNVLNPSGESFGEDITMDVLARKLAYPMRRPVINRTGLTGIYDFSLDPIDPENHDGQEGGLLVTKSLGLSLATGRAPVRTIVIDAANPPTPN